MSIHSTVKDQPTPTQVPVADATRRWDVRAGAAAVYDKVTTKHGWVGDYDYAWLCTPTLPFSWPPGRRSKGKQRKRAPPFYALDSELPILLAFTSGLQHALAMLAGLITPPIIFANTLNLDAEMSAYMISASLIGCGKSFPVCRVTVSDSPAGILSFVQMSRIHLFKNYYLGTGLLSVVGTSFSTLSTADAVRPFRRVWFCGTHHLSRSSAPCTPMGHVHQQRHLTGPSRKDHVQMPTAWCWVRLVHCRTNHAPNQAIQEHRSSVHSLRSSCPSFQRVGCSASSRLWSPVP